MVKFVATCLTDAQEQVCTSMGIEVMKRYARSLGELTPNCVTDFSVHCFNSATLEVLQSLGVRRATLHPELNLAQIRDLKKCIDTEIIIYGKIPLMEIKNPQVEGILTDRKGAKFFMHGDFLFNSVPIFVADKLNEVEKSGITHGRLIFTTEDENETRSIIKANMKRKAIKLDFTRGKFFSKV